MGKMLLLAVYLLSAPLFAVATAWVNPISEETAQKMLEQVKEAERHHLSPLIITISQNNIIEDLRVLTKEAHALAAYLVACIYIPIVRSFGFPSFPQITGIKEALEGYKETPNRHLEIHLVPTVDFGHLPCKVVPK